MSESNPLNGTDLMNRDETRKLDEACEWALADVLRRHYPEPVPVRVRKLMARAAVAVLEDVRQAAEKTEPDA